MPPFWFNPLDAFAALNPENAVLLYSPPQTNVTTHPSSSLEPPARWSYLCVNPFLEFKARGATCWVNGKPDPRKPLEILKELYEIHRKNKTWSEHGPPFQGGMVGYPSYEALHYLEDAPKPKTDDLHLPWLHFLFFDHGLAFDHQKKKVLSFGDQEKSLKLLQEINPKNRKPKTRTRKGKTGNIASNFTQKQYLAAVNAIKEKIKTGETFQANLSQRFQAETTKNPFDVFIKLNQINPSPYAAYFTTPETTIASASPELLFSINGQTVTTRPIAGTRPRGKTKAKDQQLELELKQNAKENAEHAMLVDLERNDVGKISLTGTVLVQEGFTVERYSHVMHLVSQIQGTLKKDATAFDALSALFPGGTITGCPKVRTMQILREVEPVARGPYTGSLGFIGWNGDAAFNILIRTLYFKKDENGKQTAYFHAGGGIVADSVPEKEYQESLDKAEAMKLALR
ncbi:anthranilate synthase component I family protein [Candidatus Micrarchaeota archaeon]|nr:anthranilate synthase component I family protein [Candidatus Micrarchaeota archaeon]